MDALSGGRVVAGLVLAAYVGALMFAAPSGAQTACSLAGSWNQSTPEVGSTTWVIQADGKAQEQGIGNAKGPATLSGGVLTIEWRTDEGTPNNPDDDYAGTYRWTLDANCKGEGTLTFTKTGPDPGDGRTGKSYRSTVTGPPPTPPPPPPPRPARR